MIARKVPQVSPKKIKILKKISLMSRQKKGSKFCDKFRNLPLASCWEGFELLIKLEVDLQSLKSIGAKFQVKSFMQYCALFRTMVREHLWLGHVPLSAYVISPIDIVCAPPPQIHQSHIYWIFLQQTIAYYIGNALACKKVLKLPGYTRVWWMSGSRLHQQIHILLRLCLTKLIYLGSLRATENW